MPSKKLFLASTILIVLITFPLIGSVGASSEMWSRTYGGASSDYAEAMVQTSDGGFAIAGGASLVKTDAYGNMLWNQTCPVFARSLVETSDGGFAIAGGPGLVKTDAYGNME